MLSPKAVSQLQDWFLLHRRPLPWRQNPSPYQVWVSEVMLQQTQAARVALFYEKWMERFPSIQELAKATEEEVFKCWEGLGYYSRARSLHRAAQELVSRFDGKLPDTRDALLSIKGLGPYTSSAIAAFGFHQKAAAVDGNVIRVLTRLFEIEADISKTSTQRELRALAETLLPDEEPWVVAEALIELGACICRPKPNCQQCPLKTSCQSFGSGRQSLLPMNSRKILYETLFREVVVIVSGKFLLLRQGKKGKACADLFEFPYFESVRGGWSQEVVSSKIAEDFGLSASFYSHLDEQRHSFTRFRVTLMPKLFEVSDRRDVPHCSWYDLDQVQRLTFSSGHRRILHSLHLPLEV